MVNSELNVKPFRWFIYQNVKVRTTLKTGTIERWNGGMVEWWNGGLAENDTKILKHGTAENDPES